MTGITGRKQLEWNSNQNLAMPRLYAPLIDATGKISTFIISENRDLDTRRNEKIPGFVFATIDVIYVFLYLTDNTTIINSTIFEIIAFLFPRKCSLAY